MMPLQDAGTRAPAITGTVGRITFSSYTEPEHPAAK